MMKDSSSSLYRALASIYYYFQYIYYFNDMHQLQIITSSVFSHQFPTFNLQYEEKVFIYKFTLRELHFFTKNIYILVFSQI